MSVDEAAGGTAGPSMSGRSISSISSDHFVQIMQAIEASQARMDEKFVRFQAEVRQGQEEAAAKALKRAKYEKPYTYRQKGNEAQAIFNAKVDEALAQTESDLADVPSSPASTSAIHRVLESVQKGRALLEERQKLIRLADRSEHGWGMVDEYMADDLAEDSEDEKKIEKAERAAERKASKQRRKRPAESVAGKPRGGFQRYGNVALPPVIHSPAAPPLQQFQHQTRRQVVPSGSRPVGPCHFCGEMGHLRLSCPTRSSMEGKKWYPFPIEECADVVDCNREVICRDVNRCTVDVNALKKGSTETDGNVNNCADCLELSNMCERCVLDMHSCTLQSNSQEVLGAPQKGAQFWEVGVDDLSMPVSVKGRLRDNLSFWKEVLCASPVVLKVIESGYVLPFMSEPTQYCGKNHAGFSIG